MPDTERERISAKDSLEEGLSNVQRALESKYDVICSNDLIMADEFKNSVSVTLETEYDVYKYRLYGEGDGHYHVTSNLDVYEGTNLKFGKIKTDEETITQEKRFFLFKKGTLSSVQTSFNKLSSKSDSYFATKAVKSNNKPVSQHTFNFYVALVVLALLSVLAFAGFIVQGCVTYFMNTNSPTVINCVFGGAKTLWIIFAVSLILATIGAIVHKKRIKPLRPTGRGRRAINFSKYCLIALPVELVTMLLASLAGGEGFFAYTLGNLFFPVALVCVLYPIVVYIFLGLSRDEFSISELNNTARIMLTETQYADLQIAEKTVRNAAISKDMTEIRETVLRVVSSSIKPYITD